MKSVWILGLFVIIVGCNSSKSTTGGAAAYATYQENLTGSLPVYPDYKSELAAQESNKASTSVKTVDTELNQKITQIYDKNISEPYFNGFSVLVYSGIDRTKAFETQEELTENFPEIKAEMQYQEPRYLVKVGKFNYKIEAQKSFSLIKSQFPTARIIQDRFQRKEYEAPEILDSNAERQN
jgi:hypothetical protein